MVVVSRGLDGLESVGGQRRDRTPSPRVAMVSLQVLDRTARRTEVCGSSVGTLGRKELLVIRPFRRGVPLLGVLALLLALTTAQAGAIIGWCKTDPIVRIDNRVLDIGVASHERILESSTGPTLVRIFVPAGLRTEVLEIDRGFGYGWEIDWVRSQVLEVTEQGIPVRVAVRVPSTEDLAVQVQLTDAAKRLVDQQIGRTNDWVRTETVL